MTGACDATELLINGKAILSLHTSKATLTNVVVYPPSVFGVQTYSGELEGKLRCDFSVGGISGTAKLNILGTAIYACLHKRRRRLRSHQRLRSCCGPPRRGHG